MSPFDVVVVGGGINGLVCATTLAKAGRKVVLLERLDRVGGCATLAHTVAIDPAIVKALDLGRHGLRRIVAETAACAPAIDGRSLVLWTDTARAVEEIGAFSKKDAAAYPRFLASFAALSGVVRRLAAAEPPSIDDPSAADVFELLKTGRSFRALGKADAYRLIRWMPMAIADLVGEYFESEPLKATIAAGGVLGSFLGPRSAGSAAVLMLLGAVDAHPIASGWCAAGGSQALIAALKSAAVAAGVQVRTNADVARVDVADESTAGVTLADGETIAARVVVSGVDPKRTLLGLVGALHLEPGFVRRVQNIRAHGTIATVKYTVASLPRFGGLANRDANQQTAALSGRIRLARGIDSIERAFDAAKYGGLADEPWIELAIPSLTDPSTAQSGQHVVSAYVQYVPADTDRERLGAVVTRTIAQYAPGFEQSIVGREVMTPLDIERAYGPTGGHIFHGELALDQLFVTRPVLGWARYATPIRGLYLCSAGTHPGINGVSGALAAKAVARAE